MTATTFNLSRGSLLKNTLSLSWPILISYFLQLTVSLADLKMVSYLGTVSIAAIGLAQQLVIFVFLVCTAIAVGTSIYVSQYTGRDDIAKIKETIAQTLLLSIIIGGIVLALSLAFARPLLALMKAQEDVLIESGQYFMTVMYFAPAMLLNYTINSVFFATGDSRSPLYIMLLINVLNIVFNYCLIFGIWIFPELKITGAALGTGLSRVIGLLLSLAILHRKGLIERVKSLGDIFMNTAYIPRYSSMRRIFNLGFPSTLQDVSWSISIIVVYKILAWLPQSTQTISAFSIGFNIESICFIPGIAFMQTATVMTGQNMGAKNIDTAKKSALLNSLLGSGLMQVLGLGLLFFPELIMSFFTGDKEVIRVGSMYLVFMGAVQFFLGMKLILMGALRGAGDTKSPLYIEIVEHWLLRIPILLIAATVFNCGTDSIWLTMALTNVVGALLVLAVFARGRWAKINLV